jgi:hypothetical protein
MFTSYLHRKVAAMERAFSYDAAYVHEMLDASTSAFIKFAMFQRMAAHCDSVSREAWYAAKLAAVIAEDCGPCAQLTVDMALQAGVDPKIIAALTGARVYPTLKRGLGHGASCQKLVVADDTIAVRRAA